MEDGEPQQIFEEINNFRSNLAKDSKERTSQNTSHTSPNYQTTIKTRAEEPKRHFSPATDPANMGNSESKKSETSDTGVINNEVRMCPPTNPLEDHIVPVLYILLGAVTSFVLIKAYLLHKARLKKRYQSTPNLRASTHDIV
ncbi:hypothetical protein ABEB36_015311 [Hypothenemus hampei]|uniref:Uncharacterized protein n=1 Tax=Hypothenemus hampei TaxID=57062 RepID=A0ABD1DZU2_HYPHA